MNLNDFFRGRTAVITGAGSGLGLEFARLGAHLGMNLALADVQAQALQEAADGLKAAGAQVLAEIVDVRDAEALDRLAALTDERFGAPHLVMNNAGVGTGGLLWEHSLKDWDWVLGVNLMGVVHGVRAFTPRMLQAGQADPGYRGHIVNTASMAGLVNMPTMGAYNVSKHAVVSLSETLFQDLALVSDQVSAHVLCPYFVPTAIHQSERVRPDGLRDGRAVPTTSQRIAQAGMERAVTGGKISAAEVALRVFEAVAEGRFYIFSHPQALEPVKLRAEDIVQGRNPSDPYRDRPELGAQLRAALRSTTA